MVLLAWRFLLGNSCLLSHLVSWSLFWAFDLYGAFLVLHFPNYFLWLLSPLAFSFSSSDQFLYALQNIPSLLVLSLTRWIVVSDQILIIVVIAVIIIIMKWFFFGRARKKNSNKSNSSKVARVEIGSGRINMQFYYSVHWRKIIFRINFTLRMIAQKDWYIIAGWTVPRGPEQMQYQNKIVKASQSWK